MCTERPPNCLIAVLLFAAGCASLGDWTLYWGAALGHRFGMADALVLLPKGLTPAVACVACYAARRVTAKPLWVIIGSAVLTFAGVTAAEALGRVLWMLQLPNVVPSFLVTLSGTVREGVPYMFWLAALYACLVVADRFMGLPYRWLPVLGGLFAAVTYVLFSRYVKEGAGRGWLLVIHVGIQGSLLTSGAAIGAWVARHAGPTLDPQSVRSLPGGGRGGSG